MYKTKKEVDSHVRTALSKLRSETERNLRSLTIAKLYYKINEFSSAEQYISAYLTTKDDNDEAHKLLGQCYQRLKKPEKALLSLQRSLQLNPKQPAVLADVCQLLLEDKSLDTNKANYWCELAESEKVQHDAVFSLRLKLMSEDNLEANQVEELIQKEITARPNDVKLRVRLVRNYIEQNKILAAFKYTYNLEMTTSHDMSFSSSGEWYNVVWVVLSKYEQMPNIKKDWEFWLLLVICLERQIYISLLANTSNQPNGGTTETANLLFSLDQYLYKISQITESLSQQKELVARFLNHYCGQLLLHSVSLIFKRELIQNKNKWKETINSALPLLLLAYQCDNPDAKEPWMKHCNEQGKHLIQLWNREGAFRCAQVGRTLLSCISDDLDSNKENSITIHQQNTIARNQQNVWASSDELILQIRQICTDKAWRRNIFGLLFCNSDQKVKEQSSLLIKCSKLAEPQYEMLTIAEVERFEESAQYLSPQSLQHMVYLCLGNDKLASVRVKFFSGLNFSTQNLSFCSAESLNQLDIETFLYAATIQAARMLEVEHETIDKYNSESTRRPRVKPRIMPFVNLQSILCTEEQANWWTAAYKVYKNLASDNLAEMRANLQYGIEAVRGINGPKIDMMIVFKLAKIFIARAQHFAKPVEKTMLEARADCICKNGLNMFKISNKGVLEPFRKYFKYMKANCSAVEREVAQLAEDAASYLAASYFKQAEYEELIEELNGVQLPLATYLQSEAYRKLDEANNKTPKKTVKGTYLDRASECLNETLSLLNSSQSDSNHTLNSIIHSKLKSLEQDTTKLINESAHISDCQHRNNNSSSYEDAEDDFFNESSPKAVNRANLLNRSRRESATLSATPRNTEHEILLKPMTTLLTTIKNEICSTFKQEILSLKKETLHLKEKLATIEELMKKETITSNPPSRDEDASNILDELYIIDDALQNQVYSTQQQQQQQQQKQQLQQQMHHHHHHQITSNMYGGNGMGGMYGQQNINVQQPPPVQHQHYQQQQQQQRIQNPNTMQMQQTVNAAAAAVVAAAYNSPLYNPNYPMNYYTPPYMMTPQQVAGGSTLGNQMGQRNPLSAAPYMDPGMSFNMQPTTPLLPPSTPLLPPPPSAELNRQANLFGLITQQQQPPPHPHNLSSFVPSASAPAPAPVTLTPAPVPAPIPLHQQTPVVGPILFNKSLNNMPVEKGPPVNVVITNSDPLPINSGVLQTQPPVLSVTIPSHHIKQSSVSAIIDNVASGLGGSISSTSINSPFAGIGGGPSYSITTTTSSSRPSSISTNMVAPVSAVSQPSTFSFKPQIAQTKQAEASTVSSLNKISDSITTVRNKAGSKVDTLVVDGTEQQKNKPFNLAKNLAVNFAEKKTSTPSAKSENPLTDNGGVTTSLSLPTTATITTVSKSLFGGLQQQPASESDGTSKDVQRTNTNSSPFANFTFDKGFGTGLGIGTSTSAASSLQPFTNIFSNLGKTSAEPSPITPLGTADRLNKSGASDIEEEYIPTAQFKPVIPLPNLVEVTTGEENEIVLFEHRAKLLRFDKAANEWKERGLGNIKILQDKADTNKVRIVMRREIVHKLCCNQRLYKDTSFKYGKNSQTALVWAGPDYSENELQVETLTVRFKTADICKSFYDAVLKAQANMSSEAKKENAEKAEEARNAANSLETNKETSKGFGDSFKPKAGSWTCEACYTLNLGEQLYCAACESPKDSTVPKKEPASILTTAAKSSFSFGFGTGGAVEPSEIKPAAFSFGLSKSATLTENSVTTATSLGAGFTSPALPTAAPATTGGGFGDHFKPKEGTWECQGCYLSNSGTDIYCRACNAPKDDTVPKKEQKQPNILALSNPSQKFSFGFAAPQAAVSGTTTSETKSFSFSKNAQETALSTNPVNSAISGGFNFRSVDNRTAPFGNQSIFGSSAVAKTNNEEASKSFSFTPAATTTAVTDASTSAVTSISKPSFSFSMNSKVIEPQQSTVAEVPTSAGAEVPKFTLDKKNFSFVLKPKSPGGKSKSPLKSYDGDDGGDDDGDYHEEEENNTYFTPVIPLPEKVEVKTGEEGENVVYQHRAKLYRFVEGEWKERGLGDVKILRHKETKKLRVVMRREQILKICLNHVLTEEVQYKRKDDKSWLFVVNDFSEGEVELHQFSLRFKTKDVADSFMDAVKQSLNGDDTAIQVAEDHVSTQQNASSIIIDADKELAEKLQLPHGFFETPQLSCPGCRGCDPDAFVFPVYKDTNEFFKADVHPIPLEIPELITPKKNHSFLKASALSPAAFTTPHVDATKPKNNIFGSVFGLAAEVNPSTAPNTTFSFTQALNSTTKQDDKVESGGFLFGNAGGRLLFGATADDKKSVFGGTSIFGGGSGLSLSTADKTKSIFGGASSIFGGSGSNDQTKPIGSEGASIFSGNAATSLNANTTTTTATDVASSNTTTKSVFSGSSLSKSLQNSAPLFGSSTFGFSSSTKPLLFGGISANSANDAINSTTSSSSLTVASNTPENLFAIKKEDSTSSFAGMAKPKTEPLPFTESAVSAIDFASLAAKASQSTSAADAKPSPGPGGFIGLTGTNAFSNFLKASNSKNNSLNTSKTNDPNDISVKSEEGVDNDENYDPHYEPIIALPDEIVLATGEEDETKLFGERAKLFRFDDVNKEWKERGVGEIKILKHSEHGTYRLIMRREQIHKLVLNHAVGADFVFNQMGGNPKSYVWAAMNYAEQIEEPELEKLAVRFRSVELAQKFEKELRRCIEDAKNHLANENVQKKD